MEQLLKDLNLQDEGEWDSMARFKSRRKASFTDPQNKFMKFAVYNENAAVDENEGFITVESNNRVQQLRAVKDKPLYTYQPVAEPQKKVKYATQTGGVKQSKQAKVKAAMQTKAQGKVKFTTIGEVKAEWVELFEYNYTSIPKTALGVETTVISEPEAVPNFNQQLGAIKPKKPVLLQVKNENKFDTETLFKNKKMAELWNTQEIPEGHFGFFMQENTLLSFASIIKREFPFNVSIVKKGNKYAFISDYSNNNYFSVLKSYNENAQKPWSEKEDDIAQISVENTLIEDNFFLNSCQGGALPDSQLRYFKLTIDEKYHIYSNARVDVLGSKKEKMLVRCLFEEEKNWQNLENRLEELVTVTISNNGARAFEWIFSSLLTGAEFLILGIMARQHASKVDNHLIYKVISKKFIDLGRLFNLKNNDLYALVLNVLKPITDLKEDGNYAIHKAAYRGFIKVFQENIPENKAA